MITLEEEGRVVCRVGVSEQTFGSVEQCRNVPHTAKKHQQQQKEKKRVMMMMMMARRATNDGGLANVSRDQRQLFEARTFGCQKKKKKKKKMSRRK
jgi:hypothetical protein